MSWPGKLSLFGFAELEVPEPEDADGPVTRWEANDGIILVGYRIGGTGWITIPGVAAFRFENAGEVAACAIGGSEHAIRDAWVRSVLPLVVQARGTQVLHASAVAGPSGVVALCGTSTAGKSTVAAALHRRGHRVVADDALAFMVTDDGAAEALTLPFRLRLRPASAAHLESAALAEQGDGGERLPLAAVILLEPGADGDSPRFEHVTPAEAVGKLMPHAYCFALEEGKEELVRAYAALTGSVVVRRLSFPRVLDQLAATVDHVEALLDA